MDSSPVPFRAPRAEVDRPELGAEGADRPQPEDRGESGPRRSRGARLRGAPADPDAAVRAREGRRRRDGAAGPCLARGPLPRDGPDHPTRGAHPVAQGLQQPPRLVRDRLGERDPACGQLALAGTQPCHRGKTLSSAERSALQGGHGERCMGCLRSGEKRCRFGCTRAPAGGAESGAARSGTEKHRADMRDGNPRQRARLRQLLRTDATSFNNSQRSRWDLNPASEASPIPPGPNANALPKGRALEKGRGGI